MAATSGHLDADFLRTVGTRLRRVRRDQQLTVQHLADQAGISRRLLTQIEHGQANPSLVTITRLARRLGTDLAALLDADDGTVLQPTRAQDRVLVWSSDLGSTAHLLAVTGDSRRADLWYWRLAPTDIYHGRADPAGSYELFHVLAGTLTITVGDDHHRLHAGDSASLRSDRPYAYRNDETGSGAATDFIRTVALAP